MKRQIRLFVLGIFGGFLILNFQNCSKVSFTNAQVASQNSPNSPSAPSSPGLPPVAPAAIPLLITPPAPTALACPIGETNSSKGCVPCANFVALPVSGTNFYDVPAADGNCYYIHIINSVDLGSPISSSNWQTSRLDVVSRNHDVPHGNWNPLVIGSTKNSSGSINVGAVSTIQVTLQGVRTVTLAGSPSGNVNMLVDNFILLEMQSRTLGLQNLAEGTADALPWANPGVANSLTTAPITVGGQPIQYVSFATGGTTDITPVNLSPFFPINDPVSMRTTGLDCGGVGDISDIYLLFQ